MPHRFSSFFLLAALLLLVFPYSAAAHKDKKRYASVPPLPAVYKESCGGCHTAYGAHLLPAASWDRLLKDARDHFGTELEIDADTDRQLRAYLHRNAADTGNTKLGKKIMRDLSGIPDRISTLPYIAHKHRKLDPSVFALPSVNGLHNCAACHPGAEQGDFDDDRARIPRR